MKKKNGFTLIELLAVIIILGILMIIAIPSVTKYISDSRKSAYIDTAKEIIGGAKNVVNEGTLEMYDTDATYYIEVACIKSENKITSPYDEFEKAYVVVTYDGKGYTYYWTSVDKAGEGIKNIVRYDHLDIDNIESNLTSEDVPTNRGIDGRSKTILVSERNDCKKEEANDAEIQINGETGEDKSPITYPEGKNRSTVAVGDIVKIGTEEFYVLKRNGSDLILLAHYNLKVGYIYENYSKIGEYTSNDSGYGLQNSDVKGFTSNSNISYGTMSFTMSAYWNGGIGTVYPGRYCVSSSYTEIPNCAYVYDNRSYLKAYVDSYKTILEGMGVEIKEARLLRIEELLELTCRNGTSNCSISLSTVPTWIYETSYWLGSATHSDHLWAAKTNGSIQNNYYNYNDTFGVRPVIVI